MAVQLAFDVAEKRSVNQLLQNFASILHFFLQLFILLSQKVSKIKVPLTESQPGS